MGQTPKLAKKPNIHDIHRREKADTGEPNRHNSVTQGEDPHSHRSPDPKHDHAIRQQRPENHTLATGYHGQQHNQRHSKRTPGCRRHAQRRRPVQGPTTEKGGAAREKPQRQRANQQKRKRQQRLQQHSQPREQHRRTRTQEHDEYQHATTLPNDPRSPVQPTATEEQRNDAPTQPHLPRIQPSSGTDA